MGGERPLRGSIQRKPTATLLCLDYLAVVSPCGLWQAVQQQQNKQYKEVVCGCMASAASTVVDGVAFESCMSSLAIETVVGSCAQRSVL